MKSRFTSTYLLLFIFILVSCQTVQKSPEEPAVLKIEEEKETTRGFVESQVKSNTPDDAVLLDNVYYSILYSSKHNIAYYSSYKLTAANLKNKKGVRKDRFIGDRRLKERSLPMPVKTWYKTPYDRGHLAPADDFRFTQEAVDSTFLMSNMAPQKDKFNQVAWKALENAVRGWACKEGELIVISGPIIEEGLPLLNDRPLPIPQKFFKVVFDATPPHKAIGFIMYQTDTASTDYESRVVTVKDIEKKIGLDLFSDIDEKIQKNVEGKSDLKEWKQEKCE